MTSGCIIWPPYPFRAGFCVTDDTDAASFEQIRAVYDFLRVRSFPTTKTVWPFEPIDACGIPPTPASTLRGVTLQDDRYLAYCRDLDEAGYEICLHGASAGNNPREVTLRAIEFMQERFTASDTFVCHAKNAENVYWEEKVTRRFPFRQLLRRFSRHRCSGEEETSSYYWGDACRRHLNQVRLYRTRRFNTLRHCPAMPYHDRSKPDVNGWFAATKRSLPDCVTEPQLERLKRERGLTVLYQYLHRWADPVSMKLKPEFVTAVERIAADEEILVDTVSRQMQRLRLIQGLFLLHRGKRIWLVNTNQSVLQNLQLLLDCGEVEVSGEVPVTASGRTLVFTALPPGSVTRFVTSRPVRWRGRNAVAIRSDRQVELKLPFGRLWVDLSDGRGTASEGAPAAADSKLRLEVATAGTGLPLLSELSGWEEYRLILGQMWIIARELLWQGRSLDPDRYLDDSGEIRLEDHKNW